VLADHTQAEVALAAKIMDRAVVQAREQLETILQGDRRAVA
jgi:hypothetical protein